MLTGQDSLGK